jgi:site-specific DNA-methyltransferase (adenine-specific)
MNELIHGDVLKELPKLSSDSVDLVVTSPPYNVGVDYGEYKDDRTLAEYKNFVRETFDQLSRVVKDSGRVCVNISLKNDSGIVDTPFHIKEIASDLGWDMRFEIIWDKGSSESSSAWGSWRSPSSPRPIFNHEYIFVYDVGDKKKESEKTIEKERFMNLVKSMWRIKPQTVSDHPAAFPEEVPRRLIELNSYEGDVVLDPFAGSGTTLCVAKEMQRNYVGIELEEKYINMARERLFETVNVEENTENGGIFEF